MLTHTYLPTMQQQVDRYFSQTDDVCRKVLDPQHPLDDADYLEEVAHIKRFLEVWTADAAFREAVAIDPVAATKARGLKTNPDEIRRVWDARYAEEAAARQEPPNRAVLRHRAFMLEKLLMRDRLREELCAPQDARHRAWRERQVKRVFSELGDRTGRAIVHAPFCIELSQGCSVGCWFCGLKAGKKEADFLYTDAHAALWKEVLHVLRATIGPNAWTGFLYWATDPLDNPDYERFCFDYSDILGCCPQTTTAQAQRQVERLRPFLPESFARGCRVNRFSILSLGMLEKVHAAFSAKELLHTELITQNPESNSMLGKTGRARDSVHLQRKAERLGIQMETLAPGTISCVSGFLLNMVERSVRLVSPCSSSERWPLGYWVYEEGHFKTADELADLLQGMVSRHLQDALTYRDPVAFRPDLRFAETPDSVVLTGLCTKTTMAPCEGIQVIGRLVAQGDLTAGELAFTAEASDQLPLSDTFMILDTFWRSGLLDEDPVFFGGKRDL